jgi:hypothetical protein
MFLESMTFSPGSTVQEDDMTKSLQHQGENNNNNNNNENNNTILPLFN